MNWRDRITAEPTVCHGKPCVKGTRVLVTVILDELAAGQAPAQIVAEYPTVRLEDVHAAIAYAAELSRERMVTLPG